VCGVKTAQFQTCLNIQKLKCPQDVSIVTPVQFG